MTEILVTAALTAVLVFIVAVLVGYLLAERL